MELFFHWVRYGLIVWGLAYIITQSSIMIHLRLFMLRRSTLLGALVVCPACTGFWIGLVLGLCGLYGPSLSPLSPAWLESALIATVLGYFWGAYFGDAHAFEKMRHELAKERLAGEEPEGP